jgi:hypothetical protein
MCLMISGHCFPDQRLSAHIKIDKPVTYPSDPNQVVWNYTLGVEPVDPTNKQIGEHIGRLVAWYTNGGFTDELGTEHKSGYHYKFPSRFCIHRRCTRFPYHGLILQHQRPLVTYV